MKQRPNAWINIVAFAAGIVSAVSGIVLWLMPSGGYRGGRGVAAPPTALGLSHDLWNDLHLWGSLVLVGLVLVHLVVHWCWIKKLPRILSKPKKKTAPTLVASEDICEVNVG